MAKIKFYKTSGLQKQTTQINSIDKSDNFEEKKAVKSKLLKQQGTTHIKAKDVVVFAQSEEVERSQE